MFTYEKKTTTFDMIPTDTKPSLFARLAIWWQTEKDSIGREVAERQYMAYLDKLTPLHREHRIRCFVARALPGYHIQRDPRRG